MKLSIWMCPWDLEGRDPEAVLDELQSLGLNCCSLAVAYHGGRMLLPRHPWRMVYEQHPSALYFEPDLSRFGRLKPAVSPLAGLLPPFLQAARRRGFPVEAWTVFCHNDYLGATAPDCCVENAFGDRYTYALCPSHPDVRAYILALGEAVAKMEGIAAIDVEALSYMGYEHLSLHDKRGTKLSPAAAQMLSVCFCRYCRARESEEKAEAARRAIRAAVNEEAAAGLPAIEPTPIPPVLRELRSAAGGMRLNLRVSPDRLFHGGKTAISFEEAAQVADEATLTFFGTPVSGAPIPPRATRPLPVRAGFVFHGPDCSSEADVRNRLETLAATDPDGISFYSYSMASRTQLEWLRRTLKGVTQ